MSTNAMPNISNGLHASGFVGDWIVQLPSGCWVHATCWPPASSWKHSSGGIPSTSIDIMAGQ